jgi:hypothetical protein
VRRRAAGSLVPISMFGVDARYGNANERYGEDSQDDVAHASLPLKKEPSQPSLIGRVNFPLHGSALPAA